MAFTLPTTLSQWSTLSNKEFADSSQLFEWLQSAEGGHLRIRQSEKERERYAIIYYSKKHSNMKLGHVRECRSVVWDTKDGKLACRSHGHSRPLSEHSCDDDVCSIFELVDGVMVNMFWDADKADWRLATRTCLDATNSFYGTRSFADLFWETFHTQGLDVKRDLDSTCYYSWVLQHPEERIVVAPLYGTPKLWVVSISPNMDKMDGLHPFLPSKITLPENTGLVEFITNEGARRGPQFQGVTFYTEDGSRYKMRTAEYNRARNLRGNQAKRPYHWLELWGNGQFGAYLKLYPEEKCDAEAVVEAFKSATQELYDLYQKVYRRKELPLGEAPQKYRKLLWEAHHANAGAYFPKTRSFMNKQDTARKLWLVNYERRYTKSV